MEWSTIAFGGSQDASMVCNFKHATQSWISYCQGSHCGHGGHMKVGKNGQVYICGMEVGPEM